MSNSSQPPSKVQAKTAGLSQRMALWLEDPLGQVVAASVATIGSLGVVLSGIWLVNIAVN